MTALGFFKKGLIRTETRRAAEQGFSLVELMVVITIIGILAGIAVPKFQSFRARASQTEAKSGLNSIFLGMQAYEANYGTFPATPTGAALNYREAIAEIGFTTGGTQPRYRFAYTTGGEVTTGQPQAFAAAAKSIQILDNDRADIWRINTNKWLCQPFDAVTAVAARQTDEDLQTATDPRQCLDSFPSSAVTLDDATNPPTLKPGDCPLGRPATGTCG